MSFPFIFPSLKNKQRKGGGGKQDLGIFICPLRKCEDTCEALLQDPNRKFVILRTLVKTLVRSLAPYKHDITQAVEKKIKGNSILSKLPPASCRLNRYLPKTSKKGGKLRGQ